MLCSSNRCTKSLHLLPQFVVRKFWWMLPCAPTLLKRLPRLMVSCTCGQTLARRGTSTGFSACLGRSLSPACAAVSRQPRLWKLQPRNSKRCHYQEADLAALQEIAEERHRLGEYLQRHMQLRRQIPIALGSGETSPERKLIAMFRKVYAECQSMQATQIFLSKVRGFCTDLGTESGLADADGCQLADVLPAWFHDSGLEGEATVSAPQLAPAPNSPQAMHHGYVFPNSLPSPGLLRVFHNMCADIYRSFAKLTGTCLLGTPWEFMKSRLETGLEKPALWRWSTIQTILPKLLGFKRLLQTIWDPHKFGQQGPVNLPQTKSLKDGHCSIGVPSMNASSSCLVADPGAKCFQDKRWCTAGS